MYQSRVIVTSTQALPADSMPSTQAFSSDELVTRHDFVTRDVGRLPRQQARSQDLGRVLRFAKERTPGYQLVTNEELRSIAC